jgi:hypothetical protein
MGIVFRVRESALDREVALKVLTFDAMLNPDAYTRFEREAKLAARLDHPNIVPIFAVGQRGGIAFYTMRLVRGGSVEQLLTGGTPLPAPRAIGILRDVASALDYAHANGVVHRDIKPANVLLGESGHAMVADFGIARGFGGETQPGSTTASSTGVVGSPAYMSPEQWRGEKVDGKADQYALGVLAYELFSGKRPFGDASLQDLLRMHLTADPPDLRVVSDDVPAHANAAIRRAMAKDPADRFASATAFVAALERGEGLAPVTGTARDGGAKSTRPLAVAGAPARGGSWGRSGLLLLVAVGVVVGLAVMRQRRLAARDAAVAATPATPAAPAPDSAQAAENARLQAEVADARRIALDAERKLERLQSANGGAPAAASAATGPGKPEAHAHLFVMVRGGTPAVYVDGEQRSAATPAVIEVRPGRHVVTVRGMQPFYPSERTVDLAVGDTTQLLFASKRVVATPDTIDPRALTPMQRQALLRAKKQRDAAPRPARRP